MITRFLYLGIFLALQAIVVHAQGTNPNSAESRDPPQAQSKPSEEASKSSQPKVTDETIQRPGANPVSRHIDFGRIKPGESGVVDHRIRGGGISLPKCVHESREGEPCR